MLMFRRSLIFLLVLIGLAIGWSWYSAAEDEQAVVLDAGAAQVSEEVNRNQVAVYVTGAVKKPGVVYVDFDSRVGEAINQCEGVLPTADLNGVNMAKTVQDGMHIKVPEKSMAVLAGNAGNRQGNGNAGSKSSGEAGGNTLVNINQGDVTELQRLKGIGPSMAQRIIDYRNENGLFQAPEDLQKVKGIGPAKYAKLKDQVTL